MARSAAARAWLPALVGAVVGTALAVLVNLATEWKSNPWAWVAVVVLTLTSAGVTFWLRSSESEPQAVPERPSAASHLPAPEAPREGAAVINQVNGRVTGTVVQAGDIRGPVLLTGAPIPDDGGIPDQAERGRRPRRR
ncbi:MAG TPA: hypothetical protein VIL00_15985 [Pseudonocardiaceae bacterium]